MNAETVVGCGYAVQWIQFIQRSERSKAHKFPPVCLLVTESHQLPFAHTRHCGKNLSIWCIVYLSTNTKAKWNKNPNTFQSGPHFNTNAFNSTHKSHKFPPCHSCDLLEIALALRCQLRPCFQRSLLQCWPAGYAVTPAHLIKPISVCEWCLALN